MTSFRRNTAFLSLLGILLFSAPDASLFAQEIPYEVKVNYSLAAENFKNKDYRAALPYLKWLMENAPTLYNGERIHRRAYKSYEAIAKDHEEDSLSVAYLDSALHILETTPSTFADAGAEFDSARWAIDFGNFLVAHRGELPSRQHEAVEHYLEAYELEDGNLDSYYLTLIPTELARLDRRQDAVDFMDDAEAKVDDPDVITAFDVLRNDLFKSPEERIAFLKGQLEKNPDNIEIIKELFDLYRAQNMSQRVESMGERLLQVQPSVRTYQLLADMNYQNAEYRDAIEYGQQALELAADSAEALRDIEYNIALAYYSLGQLATARRHARRALSHDSDFGLAYILIGDLYVQAVSDSSLDRDDKAVYWLALDMFERAKRIDPSVRPTADQKIRLYQQYTPTTEEKFFKGWNTGDELVINYGKYSWIGETTRVR